MIKASQKRRRKQTLKNRGGRPLSLSKIVGEGTTIRFDPKYAAKGFYVLLHNNIPVTALRDGVYVVGPEHLRKLVKAKIPYKVVDNK